MKMKSGSSESQIFIRSHETLLKPSQFHVKHLKFEADLTVSIEVIEGKVGEEKEVRMFATEGISVLSGDISLNYCHYFHPECC